MGQTVATVGIDASILIYVLEHHPQFWQPAKTALKQIEQGKMQGIFSIVGMIEVLTGPKQHKQFKLSNQYKQYIQKIEHLLIVNINDNIVEIASDLRAKYGIRTPDAIHIATAIELGAEKFITNDKRLKKVKEIEVKTL